MAQEILLEKNGEIKKAYVGFSWTVLFFGFFVPIFRRQWLDAIVMIISRIFMPLVAHALTISELFEDLYYAIPWLIFPFVYNKIYTISLLRKGYAPYSPKEISYTSKAKPLLFWQCFFFPSLSLLFRGDLYKASFAFLFISISLLSMLCAVDIIGRIDLRHNVFLILSVYIFIKIVFTILYYKVLPKRFQ